MGVGLASEKVRLTEIQSDWLMVSAQEKPMVSAQEKPMEVFDGDNSLYTLLFGSYVP
jgi:hypothetical protein